MENLPPADQSMCHSIRSRRLMALRATWLWAFVVTKLVVGRNPVGSVGVNQALEGHSCIWISDGTD